MGCYTSQYYHVSHPSNAFQNFVSKTVFKRLLEFQVGILVACMPAMNHTCHYLIPSYKALKSAMSRPHYFSTLLSTRSKQSKSNVDCSTVGTDQHSRLPQRSGNPTRNNYYENLDGQEQGNLATTGESLHSYACHGSETDIQNGGIHLTYEMRQSVYSITALP